MKKLNSNFLTKSSTPRASMFLYLFSLVVWVVSLLFLGASIFCDTSLIFWVLIFIAVIFEAFKSGTFSSNNEETGEDVKMNWFDYCLLAVGFGGALCFALCFVSGIFAGGTPEFINGSYCIIDHGDFVKYISKEWFVYYSTCDNLMFNFILIIFSSLLAFRIRGIYISQKGF